MRTDCLPLWLINGLKRSASLLTGRGNPGVIRLAPVLIACSLLFVGCGEIRYDDTVRTYKAPVDGVKYRVDRDDRATAKYTLRQGDRALVPVPVPVPPVASAVPPPPPPLVLDANNVLFDFDKSVIRPEFVPELDEWAEYFKVNPAARAQINGHADSTGPEAYNQGLSERRAQAVVDYLIRKGIDPSRLSATGFGETQPVVPNDSKANRQQNRRVELHY